MRGWTTSSITETHRNLHDRMAADMTLCPPCDDGGAQAAALYDRFKGVYEGMGVELLRFVPNPDSPGSYVAVTDKPPPVCSWGSIGTRGTSYSPMYTLTCYGGKCETYGRTEGGPARHGVPVCAFDPLASGMGEVQMTMYEHDACGDAPRAIARLDDGIPLCVTAREKMPPMEGVSSFLMEGQPETHFRVGTTKRAGGSDAASEAPRKRARQ